MKVFDNHYSKFLHCDDCHCWGSFFSGFVVFSSLNKKYMKAQCLPADIKDECSFWSVPLFQGGYNHPPVECSQLLHEFHTLITFINWGFKRLKWNSVQVLPGFLIAQTVVESENNHQTLHMYRIFLYFSPHQRYRAYMFPLQDVVNFCHRSPPTTLQTLPRCSGEGPYMK